MVSGLVLEGKRVTGVEIVYGDKTHRIGAGAEVILSVGAMNTHKLLMQSGIGDQAELQRCGIPLVQHLPGVGQNFQDHVRSACIWEYQEPLSPNGAGGAAFLWKSNPSLSTPDIQGTQVEVPFFTAETEAKFKPPATSWTLLPRVVQPKSRGHIRLTGPKRLAPIQIQKHCLSHPYHLKAMTLPVAICP